MLLGNYKYIQTLDAEVLDGHLRATSGGRLRAARLIPGGKGFKANAVKFASMPMFSVSSDFSAIFDFEPFEDLRLFLQTEGTSRVIAGGRETDIGPRNAGYFLPDGILASEIHSSGYRTFAVRIKPSELKRKLTALSGIDIESRLEFAQPSEGDDRFAEFIRRPLLSAARQLDLSDRRFHDNLLEEILALTLTRLLLFAPHNHSALFEGDPTPPGRSQIEKAEEYIAANWDKAVDVTGLAQAVGVNARTILRYFRQKHGETPRDFIRRIRLERARQMLLAGDEQTTVLGVALRCGFSSLGHFAGSYRRAFGELPSQTLKDRY